jgi:hypothetical protein
MKKYKVKSLSVGGINKVYYSGAEVTEANFPAGNCPELVSKGFLTEITEEGTKKSALSPNKDFGKKAAALAKTMSGKNATNEKDADILTAAGLAAGEEKDHAEASLEVEKIVGLPAEEGENQNAPEGENGNEGGAGEQNPEEQDTEGAKSFVDTDGNTKPVLVIDDITRKQLEAELNRLNVEYPATANKQSLYDLWVSLK